MIGALLSHYRIVEQLGAGGMGIVYRATDERLQRDVAIKVLPTGTLDSEPARQRFRREAHALSRLSHPRISTIHEFDSVADRDFLVMEFVPGVTLADRLRSGPLPNEETLRIARQIAEALEEAHEQGIVHRDLKPGNVMITEKGWIKVLDFGLAKLINVEGDLNASMGSNITESQTVVGTLPYMAPEQLLGQPVDERTDLHALGIVLYEMTTGVRPFAAETAAGVIDAILHRRPPSPRTLRPDLPPGLESIILRCLEKDPDRRYPTAAALARDLEPAGVEGAFPSRRRSPRRLRMAIGFGAAVALAGVGAWKGRDLVGALAHAPRFEAIAVLPLENLSGDATQDYFAEGMTDELTTQLARVGSLRVISRSSSAAARAQGGGTRAIAGKLHVDAVVEGSVTRSGDRVRISAKLIDAARDRYLWAQSYEREMKDVLALQGEVALAIARQIGARLSPGDRERLTSDKRVRPEAFEAYLRGRYFWNRRTKGALEEALAQFRQAAVLDSAYAPAYAGIADVYVILDAYAGARPSETFPRAREAALRALALDDGLAEAHTALARVRLHYDRDLPGAAAEFRRAIECNPGYATAHHAYSIYLRDVDRPDDAIAEAVRARALDPISPIINANLGDTYFYARRYDQAIAQHRATLVMAPDFGPSHLYLGAALERTGRFGEALIEIERARSLVGDSTFGLGPLGFTAARAGDTERARAVLRNLTALHADGRAPAADVALVEVGLGDREAAIRWLTRAYEGRDPLNNLGVDPRFDSLRGDSRFNALLAGLGLESNVVAHP
ncbi:MAG TPA: protein kinase [Candidatus Omnitrophota bacterium]|nr:protein kinase [Candidatus Omnitrophota bacterium]